MEGLSLEEYQCQYKWLGDNKCWALTVPGCARNALWTQDTYIRCGSGYAGTTGVNYKPCMEESSLWIRIATRKVGSMGTSLLQIKKPGLTGRVAKPASPRGVWLESTFCGAAWHSDSWTGGGGGPVGPALLDAKAGSEHKQRKVRVPDGSKPSVRALLHLKACFTRKLEDWINQWPFGDEEKVFLLCFWSFGGQSR